MKAPPLSCDPGAGYHGARHRQRSRARRRRRSTSSTRAWRAWSSLPVERRSLPRRALRDHRPQGRVLSRSTTALPPPRRCATRNIDFALARPSEYVILRSKTKAVPVAAFSPHRLLLGNRRPRRQRHLPPFPSSRENASRSTRWGDVRPSRARGHPRRCRARPGQRHRARAYLAPDCLRGVEERRRHRRDRRPAEGGDGLLPLQRGGDDHHRDLRPRLGGRAFQRAGSRRRPGALVGEPGDLREARLVRYRHRRRAGDRGGRRPVGRGAARRSQPQGDRRRSDPRTDVARRRSRHERGVDLRCRARGAGAEAGMGRHLGSDLPA